MTVREMHLELQQATQNVGSNRRRVLLPQEMDWVLNKVTERYINTHATSIRNVASAEHSITHMNRIQTLVRTSELPMFKEQADLTSGHLPVTVHDLLSVAPEVQFLCGAAARTLRSSDTLHFLQIQQSAAPAGLYYPTVRLTINGDVVFDAQSWATKHNGTYTGFGRPWVWQVLRMLLPELQDNVFWQWHDDVFYPDTLIFEGYAPSVITLQLGSEIYTATTSTVLRTQYVADAAKFRPGRLYFHTVLPDMINGAYTRTDGQSPLCYVEQNKLYVLTDPSYIVRGCRILYVHRPRAINVDLGIDCDLPDAAHQDICDLATEYIKNLRGDQNWEVKLQENMNRTTI
jgi:hypothetical protein